MGNPYVPLLFFLAIGGGFAIFSVAIAPLTGPRRYNRAKVEAYECGIQPSPQAEGGRDGALHHHRLHRLRLRLASWRPGLGLKRTLGLRR